MENTEIMKDGARRLATHLKQAGIQLGHGQALSALSAALGERDWKTLRAALGHVDEPASESEPVPYHEYLKVPDIGDRTVMLFIGAFATGSSYGESPRWALVEVNEAWLENLAKQVKIAADNNLDRVEVTDYPFWDNGDQFRFSAEYLRVSSAGSFYWAGYPKHQNYHIETAGLSLVDLRALLEGLDDFSEVLYYGVVPLTPEAQDIALAEYRDE
jgi:hypothetical protein